MMAIAGKPESLMRRHSVICSGMVLLTLMVFGQLRNYGFVNYDDGRYVFENEVVLRGLSPGAIGWAFSQESVEKSANWHPLTWLSLMTDVSLFGLNPSAMHVENVVIHIANVLLLFGVLVSATGKRRRSALVAAVFAVHPLHVESVAWISERKDVLSTMFVLISIGSYIRWTRKKHLRWHVLSQLAFVLSLLAKQTYVTLPFLLLLIDYWPLGRGALRSADSPDSSETMPWRNLVFEKVVYFLVAICFCCVAFFSQREGGAIGESEHFPIVERIYNAIIVYTIYIRQTLWPLNLAVHYSYPGEILFTDAVGPLLLLIVISFVAIRKRTRHPWVFMGWCWYLGTLVPVIGLVQIGSQRMADRYTYFPMVGLLIACVWFVAEKVATKPWQKTALLTSAYAVVVVLAALARVQASYWKDTMTLFTHAAEVAESSLALTSIAHEYKENGDLAKANILALRALNLDPASMSARTMLGTVALAENRPKDAEVYFRQTIRFHPRAPGAHYNLGLALVRQNRAAEAIESYHQALRLRPAKRDVRTNLGVAYITLGENDKAIEQFEMVLEASPDFAEANYNYAIALRNIGQTDRAIVHFESVIASRPELWYSHFHLAEIHIQKQRRGDALRHARIAVDLSGGSEQTIELLRQIQAE